MTRSNPGPIESVREAARKFKERYGGQAVGWAQDAVSTARTAATAKFWQQVTALLRRDMYATNPGPKRRKPKPRRKSYWKGALIYRPSRREMREINPHRMPFRHGRPHQTICPICGRPQADASSIAHAELGESLNKRLCYRSEFQDKRCTSTAGRRNPKRDGTPTRGEKRQGRFKDHLRTLRDRGQKAAIELNKLLGRAAPRGHEEPVLKAPQTETQLAHPGHYAAEESADQKYIREQLANVNALMADIREQLRDIGDDETLADGLTEQLVKLGKQRTALTAMVGSGAAPAMTNPRPSRRGRFRFRRFHPAHKAAYRRALRELRAALRSC